MDLEEELKQFKGRDPIIMVYLKSNINRLQNLQNQQMSGLLASFVLVNLLEIFKQRLRFCHMQTWWQVLQGKLLCYICDYILGLDLQMPHSG